MTGRVIEALAVRHNADVSKSAEENQRAELALFVLRRRRHGGPIRACRTASETGAGLLESAPHKPLTIEGVRPGRAVVITRAETCLNRAKYQLVKPADDRRRRDHARAPLFNRIWNQRL